MHPCVFCERQFNSLEDLVVHLCEQHRHTCLEIGDEKSKDHTKNHTVTRFEIRDHKTGKHRRTVTCLCGELFTLNQLLVGPALGDWHATKLPETNSFLAHLRREGGLAKHLQRLRDKAMLDQLARMGKPVEVFDDDDSW